MPSILLGCCFSQCLPLSSLIQAQILGFHPGRKRNLYLMRPPPTAQASDHSAFFWCHVG
ncbi:hypothetical protein LEMLEM_LOCUS1002 [Lemmus lemmus]